MELDSPFEWIYEAGLKKSFCGLRWDKLWSSLPLTSLGFYLLGKRVGVPHVSSVVVMCFTVENSTMCQQSGCPPWSFGL